jgi:hypothetical protein
MQLGKALVSVIGAGWLAACGTGQSAHPPDINKLFTVKSSFESDFHVTTKGPTDIDPKLLQNPKLPPSMTFDPPDCSALMTTQHLPSGLKGKMTTVNAVGKGNRFVAIAIQITQQAQWDPDPPKQCTHVTFTAGKVSGDVDIIDAPAISGAKTSGTHRDFRAQVRKKEREGDFYHFVANLGDYVVIVDATPQAIGRGQPAQAVDIDRARKLLTDSVAAIRS